MHSVSGCAAVQSTIEGQSRKGLLGSFDTWCALGRSSDRQVPSDTLRRVKARRTPAALRREQTRGGRSIARVCPCGCAQPGRVVSGTSLFRPTRLGAGSTRSKPCWKPKVRRAAVPTEARADRLVPAVAATEHGHSAQCGRMGRASAHTALTGSRPGSAASAPTSQRSSQSGLGGS